MLWFALLPTVQGSWKRQGQRGGLWDEKFGKATWEIAAGGGDLLLGSEEQHLEGMTTDWNRVSFWREGDIAEGENDRG